ncbi:PTS system mannitol (Cryptic)-specific transporter subunit IIA [Staphylococcus aureus]|uniref:PTS system mannitol (Cryptic)-specific transporter subunit IIA n=1 Tax=Staphylococcus aureus TaxID=1280 RepID=A0A2X2K0Z6_STAAU|nr:PTS system mannitol (Cryptic)-specific transporter subunit IIA [Staphylococcus aureus]
MLLSTREKEMIALLIKYHGQYITIHELLSNLRCPLVLFTVN